MEKQKIINEKQKRTTMLNRERMMMRSIFCVHIDIGELSELNHIKGKPLVFKTKRKLGANMGKKKADKNAYTDEQLDYMRYVDHKLPQ